MRCWGRGGPDGILFCKTGFWGLLFTSSSLIYCINQATYKFSINVTFHTGISFHLLVIYFHMLLCKVCKYKWICISGRGWINRWLWQGNVKGIHRGRACFVCKAGTRCWYHHHYSTHPWQEGPSSYPQGILTFYEMCVYTSSTSDFREHICIYMCVCMCMQ